MSKQQNFLVIIGAVILSLGSLASIPSVQAAVDPFTDFYNQNCVPEAQKAGFTQSQAQQGCTCAVNALRKKYSSDTFASLLKKFRSGDATARQTLQGYGQPCFEDFLFEK